MTNCRIILVVVFFLFLGKLVSQTDREVKKIHFVLHSYNPSIHISNYENALTNYGQLDQFRFYNKRRIVRFRNANVSVELYSAKELLDLYAKQISEFTIKDGQNYSEVEFALTENQDNIKPYFKKR